MELEKITHPDGLYYWRWINTDYLPYGWLEESELKDLPVPFLMLYIHPDCKVGVVTELKDEITNIIPLTTSFAELKIDPDLRKDLRRIEHKNENTKIIFNEENAFEKSQKWFLDQWKEEEADFERRKMIWRKVAYTLSAYQGDQLLGVHIAMEEGDTVYYLGCWWDRTFKNLSVPTFLLKRDIEKAIDEGKKFYDLGIGDEPYKKQWMVIEKPTKYYAVVPKKLAEKFELKKYREVSLEELETQK
ncbi:MAG: GNAT family N-acetyltransferase [Candidatus Diapherotrites archaeon]